MPSTTPIVGKFLELGILLINYEIDLTLIGLGGGGGECRPLMFSEYCSQTAQAIKWKLSDLLHLLFVHALR